MGYPEAQYVINELTKDFNKVAPMFGPEPKPVTINSTSNIEKNSFRLNITLHGDTVVDGYTLVHLAGVKVVYKKGSIPQNPSDGTLFTDIKSPLNGNTSVTITGLNNNQDYGIRFFPYSDKGTYSSDPANGNLYKVLYEDYVAFVHNFGVSDPASAVTYTGRNTNWSSINVSSDGTTTLNEWANWDWLKKIKYAIIDKNGHVVEDLDVNDLRRKTDGSPSSISNGNVFSYLSNEESADGSSLGFYVWFPNLYMKEVYSGTTRTVYFSTTNEGPTMSDSHLVIGHTYEKDYKGLWIPMYPNIGAGKYDMSYYPLSTLYNIRYRYQNLTEGTKSIRTLIKDYENRTNKLMTNWYYNGAPFALVLRDILFMLFKSSYPNKTCPYASRVDYDNVVDSRYLVKSGLFLSLSSTQGGSPEVTVPFGLISLFLEGQILIDIYQYFNVSKQLQYRTVLKRNIGSTIVDKDSTVSTISFPNASTAGKYSKQTHFVKDGVPSVVDPENVSDIHYVYMGGLVSAKNGFLYMADEDGLEAAFFSNLPIDYVCEDTYYEFKGIGGGLIVVPTDQDYDPNEV